MKIEFIPWSENIEIQLCDDDGAVLDRFYTRNDHLIVVNPGAQAEFFFDYMERVLGPPKIGGALAAHHPYWEERKVKRAARAAKLGIEA